MRSYLPAVVALIAVGIAASVGSTTLQDVVIPLDGKIRMKINGTEKVVLAAPDGPAYPTMTAAEASRLGVKPDFLGSMVNIKVTVGNTVLTAATGYIRVGDAEEKRRALWFASAMVPNGDIVFGPDAFTADRVTFTLNPGVAATRSISLPMQSESGLTGTYHAIGDRQIFFYFSSRFAASIATAGAAQALAGAFDGTLRGGAYSLPILFGVNRPVRHLTLSKELKLGGLPISHIDARISDYGNVGAIPDDQADPNEIVVTAGSKSKKQLLRLAVGRDDLSECASITFDRKAKSIVLRCRLP